MGGIQSVRKIGFAELRDSIPGGFVPEQDMELFYSKCKVESARTMTNALCPCPTQLFYVVVSGEVHVQMCSPDTKNKVITAATYVAGEMIHFFNSPTECNVSRLDYNEFGECLRNGDVKLALHFNHNHKNTGRVIGIDQRAYDEFTVSANGNLHNLSAFLGLNIANITRKTPFFKAITPEQVGTYFPGTVAASLTQTVPIKSTCVLYVAFLSILSFHIPLPDLHFTATLPGAYVRLAAEGTVELGGQSDQPEGQNAPLHSQPRCPRSTRYANCGMYSNVLSIVVALVCIGSTYYHTIHYCSVSFM